MVVTEFYKRSLTSIVIVAIVTFSIFYSQYSFLIFCACVNFLGLLEFYRLFKVNVIVWLICSLLLLVSLFLSVFLSSSMNINETIFLLNVPWISLIIFSVIFIESAKPFDQIAIIFLGHVYITFPILLFYRIGFLRDNVFQPEMVLGVFLLLWASDSAAYISGKILGKHFLAPKISPKKT